VSEAAEKTGIPAVEMLKRWQNSGGVWRVESHSVAGVKISLMTCTVGEEVDRLVSNDPALLAFLGDRMRSDE